MPSKVTWLPCASRDVARLRDFLKSENPRAAQRAAKRILEGVMILRRILGQVPRWMTCWLIVTLN